MMMMKLRAYMLKKRARQLFIMVSSNVALEPRRAKTREIR